ncbi:hypothetical protein BDY17DRAFT_308548 [Neohortaea acidophila]|uniref:Velvet domain-containing protein n=1 Tax=Neohortaea acidophila TaxID=245834 RepID=A0A6A6PZA2_9PEZI|nr:uncharacterized protein BDY17DRAFT_308548 [Neohortaea acidophila]KAF2485096.1 hypothetical protein BDY17DRAFT_308548 [Neohortaea acidophila]
MAERSSKTHARQDSGPQPVGEESERQHPRTNKRQRRSSFNFYRHSSRRFPKRPSRPDSTPRRKAPAVPQSTPIDRPLEQPRFALDIVSTPAHPIVLGSPIDISAVVSFISSNSDAETVDPSPLLAVASLISESAKGERTQLDPQSLSGPKMIDNIHPLSASDVQAMMRSEVLANRTLLGYVSFPSLVVRQVGSYRVRVTLLRMGDEVGNLAARSLVGVDSEVVRVERGKMGSFCRQGC